MFTGIIQELGRVQGIRPSGGGLVIKIEAPTISKGLAIGDSVAINGVCLTITRLSGSVFEADVAKETLDVTSVGGLRVNDKVNLEPALSLSDRLGGHLVTGHVDAVGKVISKTREGASDRIKIECPQDVLRYVIKKGSIAIDGISLTVAEVLGQAIEIAVIPHTSANTTLGFKSAGATVNLEADIIGKYVEKFTTTVKDTENVQINKNNFDLFKESGLL